jgi:hypothetical protein
MAGIYGADVARLRALGKQSLARWLPAFLTVLLITSCTEQPIPSKDPTMTNECKESGDYLLNQAIDQSTPSLPESSKGAEHTTEVGLMGTRFSDTPPTVSIQMISAEPSGEPIEIRGLKVGDEATYSGYTIRITGICERSARFDLIKQPD